MSIIILGFIVWLIYDYRKDQKIEKELQEQKRSFATHPTEKGGA